VISEDIIFLMLGYKLVVFFCTELRLLRTEQDH